MYVYTMLMMLLSLLFLNISFFFKINDLLFICDWMIINFMSVKFNIYIYLDFMSLMFLSLVLFISSMVMIYSIDYMQIDNNINRFNLLLIMFVFSMMMMIMSPNIFGILIGWDGLGLISYCLVIYYQNMNSFNSGMITILCNRIGDISLLMLICFSFMYGSNSLNFYSMNILMLFMLIGACFSKSAQLPFSIWLPMAMTAPTPISSLVHSSTLVTAGVYLMIRYNEMLSYNNMNMNILYISSLTMFMAGLIANFENDFKKIVALSTLSQLSLMFMILSLGNYELCFFHLFIHALFKSMMFMCVGSFIHLLNDNQDIRLYGYMGVISPIMSYMLIFSILCLCGLPFLSGFYSKDLIMEFIYMKNYSMFIFFLLMLSTIFTVSYSIRMIMYVLLMKMSFKYINLNESLFINFSIFMLLIVSLYIGNIFIYLIFNQFIIILSIYMKILMYYLILMGILFSIYLNNNNLMNMKLLYYFNNMFYLIYLFKIYYYPLLVISYIEIKLEKGLIDELQVNYFNNLVYLYILMLNFNKKFQLSFMNMMLFNMLIFFYMLSLML